MVENVNDLKNKSPVLLKISILSSLILFIFLFIVVPKFEPNPYKMRSKADVTKTIALPEDQLQKIKEPPKIEKPKLPKKIVETSSEEVTEEIEFTTTFEDPSLLTPPEGEIYRIYEEAPKVISRVEPQYPDAARQLGIEGTVFLELVVETDGTVSFVKVLKSVHPLLDDAARNAAMQFKFSPAKSRDLAVRAYLTLPVTFSLDRN